MTVKALLTALLLSIAIGHDAARATETEIVNYGRSALSGGPGGGPFRNLCGPSQYITGITINAGDFIDSITAHCSYLSADQSSFSRGVPPTTAKAGGNGGAEKFAGCATNQYVRRLQYGFTRDGNRPQYLSYVQLTCVPLQSNGNVSVECLDTSGHGCWERHPNPGRYNGYGLAFAASCSPTNLMVGLVGRSGDYVDAIGIECVPKPRPR